MNPERWNDVKALLGRALELPPTERAAFLASACPGDSTLRQEVESLLFAADGSGSIPRARDVVARAALGVSADRDGEMRQKVELALGDRYEILRELGRGGMGSVFLAREQSLGRLVAVKVLQPEMASWPEGIERFRREAVIAAQLTHPAIVPLITFGEVGGLWYFVMKYVRGETLADRLRVQRFRWPEACDMLLQLADALDYAHRQGVIHRDIKPANILLDADSGCPMLADFGIARAAAFGDSLTHTGVVVGTPGFMSPEQSAGLGDVDERSDIFALGALAYLMLTGRHPTVVPSLAPVRPSGEDARLVPPRSVVSDLPEALEAVVMRCLQVDRERRWASARALRDALRRVRGDATEMLPDPVRQLPSFGPYALLWLAAWIAVTFMTARPMTERVTLLLFAALVPVGLGVHVWNSVRSEVSLRDVLRVAFWPPEWWSMWWPRALRRPTDLYARLPWPARISRLLMTTFFVALPVLILMRQWLAGGGAGTAALNGLLLAQVASIIAAVAVMVGAGLWGRSHGLSAVESARLFFGATTSSSLWTEARIASLVQPERRRARTFESADEALRAVLDYGSRVPAPLAEHASMAMVLADRASRRVRIVEEQLAALARSLDEDEMQRLTSRLVSLDAGTSPTAEQAELHDLLTRQLAVMRRMQSRRAAIEEHRVLLLRQLQAVCLHLADLADVSEGGASPDRLRAACDALAAELEAIRDIEGDGPSIAAAPSLRLHRGMKKL